MATVNPTLEKVHENLIIFTYADMLNGDVGLPIHSRWSDFGDRTIQATGTMGSGGTLKYEGSNKNDAATMLELTDPQGNAIAIQTVNKSEQIMEACVYGRPKVSAGDGSTSITAIVTCRRSRTGRGL